jgi:hypothetical protein
VADYVTFNGDGTRELATEFMRLAENVKPFWEKSVRCLMTGQTATGVEGA